MTTQTLDQQLRERARRRLSEKLSHVFKQFDSAIAQSPSFLLVDPPDVIRTRDGEIRIEWWRVLNLMQQQIYKNSVEAAEEKEVKDFLASVDRLQQQLDELRGES